MYILVQTCQRLHARLAGLAGMPDGVLHDGLSTHEMMTGSTSQIGHDGLRSIKNKKACVPLPLIQ